MDIKLKTDLPSVADTIYRPAISLYLLLNGVGMNDEVMYKVVVLPSLWERIRYKHLRVPKLSCKEV